MFTPSPSNLLIAALWPIFISSAFLGTPQLPPLPEASNMPLMMATTFVLMPIVFFDAVSFFGHAQSPFYHPKLARFISTRYGEQACESFLVHLKPALLFGVVGMLQGAIGLWQSYSSGAPQEAYVINGIFVAAGLAFVLAYITWYLRKAVGGSPTWTLGLPHHTATPPTKTTLREALRIYWLTLIGRCH